VAEGIMIEFNQASLKSVKKAYAKAVEDGKDQFTWGGHEFVTNYAKYMIEYLEGQFKLEGGK
jgi:hypothetical protein